MQDLLNEIIEKIVSQEQDDKIQIAPEQWQGIVILIGALARDNFEDVLGAIAFIKKHGKVGGELKSLINFAKGMYSL